MRVINAFAELADPDHPARGVIAEQEGWMRGYLAELCSGAEAPEELAGRLFVLIEGATVAGAMGTVGDAWGRAGEIADVLVAGL